MKKIAFVAFLILSLLNTSHSQNIALTFTAQSGNTPISLDSIKIENLTQFCDTILYGNDTILLLSATTVNAESVLIENNLTEILNYPNPFLEQTQIKINSSTSQMVHLIVYNLKGQEVAIFNDFLSAGTHDFSFVAGTDKLYIVSLETGKKRDFIKIVSVGSQKTANCELRYNGMCMDNLVLRSAKTNFLWTPGNDLRFTGYTTLLPNIIGTHIINDTPVQSETYTFTYTPINAPVLTTTAISNITPTSASGGGNITSDGGAAVTSRGICWGTSPSPSLSDNYTTNGNGTGSFSSSLTNLQAATLYYVRAYATNAAGTAYGNELQFTTLAQLPSLTTTAINNITPTTASGGGNITSDGGAAVTSRGICWNISPNPTLAHNYSTDGSGTGAFMSTMTSLQEVTTYYVRAYATNSAGTAYGNQVQFTTTTTCVAFNDSRDGNTYQVVKIGNQCWMSENLKYLPYVYQPGSGSTSAKRYYVYGLNNSTDTAVAKAHPNYATYGVLYNWRAAMNSQSSSASNPSQRQGVCPAGWHMPSDDEWKQLEMTLGMSQAQADGINGRGTNQGSKLAGFSSLWTAGALKNDASFNSSGFNAKPGGYRSTNGYFTSLNEYGAWWTATENDTDNAWRRSLIYDQTTVNRYHSSKEIGFSVRCVKD